ncbi:MAG TPA: redoxin domain-containing protein, partial [Steroidobacteraceae bacterium]|nr:redoxin domain-containing protein [Steroidobacteraceae bacterium]
MNRKPWKSYVMSAVLTAGSMLLAGYSQAEGVITVGDFGLIDHQGVQHQLTRLGDNKAIVLITESTRCPESIDSLPRYKLLRTMWQKQGIKILLLNSSTEDNMQTVRTQAQTYDIDFPILMDETQLVAESLGVTKAGEVLVIDPNTKQLLFHGPLDRQAFGGGDDGEPRPAAARKPASTPLADVLGKVVAGNYQPTSTVTAEVTKGCAINFATKGAQAKSVPD